VGVYRSGLSIAIEAAMVAALRRSEEHYHGDIGSFKKVNRRVVRDLSAGRRDPASRSAADNDAVAEGSLSFGPCRRFGDTSWPAALRVHDLALKSGVTS